MLKEEITELLEIAFSFGKKLISLWHENKMSQIRLNSANQKHIIERQHQDKIDEIKYLNKWQFRNKDYDTKNSDVK